jgi:hypothetical protein
MHPTSFIAICAMSTAVWADSPPTADPEILALEAVVKLSPENEAAAAIARGDRKFLGVAGYSVEILGVENRIARCNVARDSMNIVRGTSDIILNDHHLELINRAREYAARYNSVIAKSRADELSRKCPAL